MATNLQSPPPDTERLRALPKAEVHLHLEGCFEPAVLAERGIPLGICPTSDLSLGVYPSMDAHPIERLRAAGVRVSVNTDDPVLLGASLVGEYALCAEAFGWSDDVLRAVARTSIEASFAHVDAKQKLLAALALW